MNYNTITKIAQGCACIVLAAAIGAGILLQHAPQADAAELPEETATVIGTMTIPAIIREAVEERKDNERVIAMQAAKREKLAKLIADNALVTHEDALVTLEDALEEPEPAVPAMTSLGYWDVTAYTWTGNRCANGEYPYEGLCAVNGLPFGTKVYIEGVGTLTVADRGGMKGTYDVDIYMDSEAACWQWGRQSLEIWIIEG